MRTPTCTCRSALSRHPTTSTPERSRPRSVVPRRSSSTSLPTAARTRSKPWRRGRASPSRPPSTGLTAVREANDRGVTMLAETCPQYLHLDVDRLAGDDGDQFVCTPPLRDKWHAEELWHGLASGWIHTVATDHCPFTTEDRR